MTGLQRVARDVLESLLTADPAGSSLAEDITLLLQLIERALDAESFEPPTKSCAYLAPRIRVLRRALVQELQRTADPEEVQDGLRVLRAIDELEEFVERDPAARFVRHLTGSDPLGSIVALAHDMRSPLTSILFLVDTLRMGHGGPVSGVRERQLGLVYSAAFGLSSMVNDVIELARGGDRTREPQPVPLSISGIMLSVQHIVQPIAEEK